MIPGKAKRTEIHMVCVPRPCCTHSTPWRSSILVPPLHGPGGHVLQQTVPSSRELYLWTRGWCWLSFSCLCGLSDVFLLPPRATLATLHTAPQGSADSSLLTWRPCPSRHWERRVTSRPLDEIWPFNRRYHSCIYDSCKPQSVRLLRPAQLANTSPLFTRGVCDTTHTPSGGNTIHSLASLRETQDNYSNNFFGTTCKKILSLSNLSVTVAILLNYSSIQGNRNWQIETADWNLDVRLDIWVRVKKLYARLEILLRNWLAGSKTVVSISRDATVGGYNTQSKFLFSRTIFFVYCTIQRSWERIRIVRSDQVNLKRVDRTALPKRTVIVITGLNQGFYIVWFPCSRQGT